MPEYSGGAGDGAGQERQVQQLHYVVQDSVAAFAAEPGVEALRTANTSQWPMPDAKHLGMGHC
jgi:hypothetical protein